MSLSLQYLLLISFLFEPFQSYLLTLSPTKSLFAKSKIKTSFYTFKRFYREHLIPVCIFLIASIFLIHHTKVFILYVVYLLLCPFIIPFTSHFLHILLLLLMPLILLNLTLHYFCIPLFIIFFIFFSHQTPIKACFFEYEEHFKIFRIVIPLILMVSFMIENRSHALLQQILIMSVFVMIVGLESCLTETKTLLETSKNRYILWHLKSEYFDLKFLNHKNRFALLSQSMMILYLSVLSGFIVKDVLIILMLLLCFIYLLFSEFDKMIQYKFFNQSVLYDDVISRFIFSQIILSGVSFYLIYLGVGQVLIERNLNLNFFDLFKFVFMIWYIIWVVVFFKRFNKKLRFNFLKITMVLTLLILTSCTQKKIESHILVDERISFTGNMVHQKTQEMMLSDLDISLKVKHQDKVKKEDTLFVRHYEASFNELKRIGFQIDKLNTKKTSLQNEIKKEKDDLLKNDLKMQLENVIDELDILQFDKNLIKTSESTQAKFDGTVLIEDNSLQVLSHTLVLNLRLNEHEYRSFKEIKSFSFLNLSDEVVAKGSKYETTYKDDAYQITFEPFKNDCYINQTLIITPEKALLFVPKAFVRVDEGKMFAKTESTEVIIDASFDDLKDGYYIHEGLKENDEVFSYETMH